VTPGTVSKILWHFTGGPPWNTDTNCQCASPKPPKAAYQALLSIISSRQLQTGKYKEVVKVLVPKIRKYNIAKKTFEESINSMVDMFSAPVCCLADIPIAHLTYHSQRYGKFAIGFHRDAAVKSGFNPVFYSLHDTNVLREVYEGFAKLRYVDVDAVKSAAEKVTDEASGLQCEKGHDVELDLSDEVFDIDMAADDIETAVSDAQDSLGTFLAFVKTFSREEFASIYCDREWRSVKTFEFSPTDIAMIVLPKLADGRKYFRDFVETEVQKIGVPRSVPVVPWEDLVEH
jgi:hypothetical protein